MRDQGSHADNETQAPKTQGDLNAAIRKAAAAAAAIRLLRYESALFGPKDASRDAKDE